MANNLDPQELPELIQQYITNLAKRIRNRHMRRDVVAELSAHFADALTEAPKDVDRDQLAASLVGDFGDAKTLRLLIKRAKKRCRPLWVKFVIRTCQSILVLLVIFAGYTYWFVSGQHNIRIDYWAKLTDFACPAADESLNAAPHYLRASEMFVEFELNYDWGKRQNLLDSEPDPQERQALQRWIEGNLAAIDQVRLGTAKPHCWFEYASIARGETEPGLVFHESSKQPLIAVTLPYLTNLRQLAEIFCWRMKFTAEKGDWDSVIADLRSAKKLARHFMQCPTLIEQLGGIRADQRANKQLIHLLRSYHLPPATLQRLAQSLSLGYPIIRMDGEAMFHMDSIQWLFTDDGSGDGHMIPGGALEFYRSVQGNHQNSPVEPLASLGASLIHSSRRDTVTLFEQWKQRAHQYFSATPYQNYVSGYSLTVWSDKTIKENQRNFLFEMLIPALDRAVWISYAGQAEHQAAATVVALLRYKAKHGQFPDSLDKLVPEYLKAIPDDPFGPGPLTYKRQGDDFILYSWGLNFEDHGGQHNRDVFVTTKPEGDYVFWPPEPVERP